MAQAVCQHEKFSCQGHGLVLRLDHQAMFGAGPDGLIECKYCGLGCLKIKWPFILKHLRPMWCVMSAKCQWWLQHYQLDHPKRYFYQVQMQMFLTGMQMLSWFYYLVREQQTRTILSMVDSPCYSFKKSRGISASKIQNFLTIHPITLSTCTLT